MALSAEEIVDHSSDEDLLRAFALRFKDQLLWIDGDYMGRQMIVKDVVSYLNACLNEVR